MTVTVNGATRKIPVSVTPNAYTIVDADAPPSAILDVTLTPGVRAFSFTFG